ncbi:unnamed protein product [Prunus brigantina]
MKKKTTTDVEENDFGEKFLSADQKVWKVGKEVAGYIQKLGSMSQVLVSRAGHLLPADQPLSSNFVM